jgi:hypothetical protein
MELIADLLTPNCFAKDVCERVFASDLIAMTLAAVSLAEP